MMKIMTCNGCYVGSE